MGWHEGRLAAFDVETTGVHPASDRIVTAAVSLVGGGLETVSRDWLVDPGVEIPAGATAVHGITTEMARAEGRPSAEAVEEITTLLAEQVLAGVPIIAFNARFDLTMLDREARRHGVVPLIDRVGGEAGMLVVDPRELHGHQVAWAAEQAASFQEYLRSNGSVERIEGAWPIVPEPVAAPGLDQLAA